MPGKVHPILPSFTTGELSPLMYGRVDFAKFASGLEVLLNYVVRPHGPVTRRAGTHFICEVKDSSKFTRLIKFEFSTTQAYQIEAGDLYFRFFKGGGQINDGVNVTITGAANNGSGLIRITTGAPHGYATGNGVSISGVVGVLIANQIWSRITVIDATHFDLVGSAFAGTYTSGGNVNKTVEVATPYLAADLPMVKYAQNADTMYFVHPNYPVQKLTRASHTSWTMAAVNFLPPMTFEAGYQGAYTFSLAATSGIGVNMTMGAGGDLLAGDVGRMIVLPNGVGRAIIKTVTAPTTGTVDIVDTFTGGVGPYAATQWTMQGSPIQPLTPSLFSPAHQITTLTLGAAGWRASDVGKYIRVNKGVVRIISFSSSTVVTGELLTALTNASVSNGGSWSIEESSWTAARGYPSAVCFHQQRLVLGGNTAQPQAFWGSATGQYEVFGLGPDDDDAYEFLIATNDVNTISWLLSTRVLLMGTASSEFSIESSPGSTNASITPNNVNVKSSTFWGSSSTVAPLRVGLAGLFVTRTGTEFREMVFSLQRDAYVADDMLLLAEHLTRGNTGSVLQITDMAYQRHPMGVVWCIRTDGALLGLTYQREHDVVGWHRQITGPDAQEVTPVKGKYEAVITTPHWQGDRDVAFFVIKRMINGVAKRFVEYEDSVSGYYGNLGMDCALTYSGAPTASVTGLFHLIGETVRIVGDGAMYPDKVVDATGTVALDGLTCTRVEVGLGFNSKLRTMRIETGNAQSGTSQGVKKHWSKIWIRVTNTIGGFVQGREVPFRGATDITGQALPLYTGDKFVTNSNTDSDAQVTVEQRQPLPQTINAIFGELAVGQGD